MTTLTEQTVRTKFAHYFLHLKESMAAKSRSQLSGSVALSTGLRKVMPRQRR